MRSTAPSKRDIVLIVPRHGGGPPPSSAVLKKARLIAKKKGKRLLPPLNVLASQPAKALICLILMAQFVDWCSGKLFRLEQPLTDGKSPAWATMGCSVTTVCRKYNVAETYLA
jgi:hypothetical protein